MILVSIFLGKNICDVMSTGNVMDIDVFSLVVLSDCVVTQLYVSNGTRCLVFAPLNACHVVIKYVDWTRKEFFLQV